MTSWADRPYWYRVDNIAYHIYQHVSGLAEKRGKTFSSFSFTRNLNFDIDSEQQIEIDIIHNLMTCKDLKAVDNIAACYADADYSEIEISTLIPKNRHVKSVKKCKLFQWDFLNVIRHELEHTIQGVNLAIPKPNLICYDRSENNFLLESCEVPAYVHGFRIATRSRSHFLESITKFISQHGHYINLPQQEVDFTIKIWYDYLKNLKSHCKVS